MKRAKAPLILMEQLAMLLIFALSAAVCLRVFAWSQQLSQLTRDRDDAALLCQNTAETLRTQNGDVVETLTEISGVQPGYRDGFGHFIRYGEDWIALDEVSRTCRYTLRVQELDSGVPGLGKAEVEAYRWQGGEMESLFRLETAWQEVSEHGA